VPAGPAPRLPQPPARQTGRPDQAREIISPETVIGWAGSGLGAGPWTTLPSLTLYLLPWQGQSVVPSATWSTMHCRWVQMALNPSNCPAAGWVTTTLAEVKTFPPPTGISLVVPSAAPPVYRVKVAVATMAPSRLFSRTLVMPAAWSGSGLPQEP